MKSRFYIGDVTHVRTRPKAHRLRYRVAHLMIDLDEWQTLKGLSRLFGVDRRGLISIRARDYLDGETTNLRAGVQTMLAQHKLQAPLGRIRLFTYPRMLGMLFNPISVFLIDDTEGAPYAALYEVANTFGERHHYVVPLKGQQSALHGAEKQFYVSPFMETSGAYRFRITDRDNLFALAIESTDQDGNSLNASFRGRAKALSRHSLLSTLLRFPLLTVKIVGGIHFEAFKLWLKGLKVYRHKSAPPRPETHSGGHSLLRERKSL